MAWPVIFAVFLSLMQRMVYEEMLPAHYGKQLDIFDNGSLQKLSNLARDDITSGPRIYNEFTTAAFRAAHSRIPKFIKTADDRYNVFNEGHFEDSFFDPHVIHQQGTGDLCRGAYLMENLKISSSFGDSVRNHLLKHKKGQHGMDLLAINIARGRDHGIPGYYKYYEKLQTDPKCKPLYQKWIKSGGLSTTTKKIDKLYEKENGQALYESRDDIDLYVGILLETHLDGADIGPTGACIQMRQFKILKDQEYWFYGKTGFWNAAIKKELIDQFDLATVLCLTDKTMKEVQKEPFIYENDWKATGSTEKCASKRQNLKIIFEKAYRKESPATPFWARKISPCESITCFNNGNCIENEINQQPKCNCIEPHFGEQCEEHPCDEYICDNGGSCSFNNDTQTAE
ncbi:unnamed protein product [Oikopleura dioica]|uniref:EGF-like domain-containing protein n=3 Tax=Oikopleura dioica TaxID=34765 RepID=E4YLR0_OIKDI|nr:unnamed protein product [Oikopleura dioica]